MERTLFIKRTASAYKVIMNDKRVIFRNVFSVKRVIEIQLLEPFKIIPVLLCIALLPFIASGQDFVNNDVLVITTNSLLHVSGNFTNDSTVYNDGTLEVEGNFDNSSNSLFEVGSDNTSMNRVVKFVGSGKQEITGNMSTSGEQSFYNLVEDQEDPSDTLEMQTDVNVDGSMIFGTENVTETYNPDNYYTDNMQLGLLKTYIDQSNEYTLNVTNGDPGALTGYPIDPFEGAPDINGGYSTGFILTSGARGTLSGGLELAINTEETYMYPIGTVNHGFNGMNLNFYAVPGTGSVTMKFSDGSSNPSGSVGYLSQYCYGCSDPAYPSPNNAGYNRYYSASSYVCNFDAEENPLPQWVILNDAILNHGYWSAQSTNTGYQYWVEAFPSDFTDEGSPLNTWRTIKHKAAYNVDPSGSSVDWRPEIETTISDSMDILYYTANTGCYSGNGVPGGVYTDFSSHFTMKQAEESNSLPVTFLYLRAAPQSDAAIQVTWATALEINNAGFEVTRSIDRLNFSDIVWVPGHDNSTVTQTYTYNDNSVTSGVQYYYKLRQMDNNKQFSYSNIANAEIASKVSFSIYPNPTDNELYLSIGDPTATTSVDIYDITGRLVFSQTYSGTNNGVNPVITIQTSAYLSSGSYLLTASANGTEFRQKVIVR